MNKKLASFKMNLILIIIGWVLILLANMFMFSFLSGMIYGLCLVGIVILSIISLVSTKNKLKLSCDLSLIIGIGCIVAMFVRGFINVPIWGVYDVIENLQIVLWFPFINGILVLVNGLDIKKIMFNSFQQVPINNMGNQYMNSNGYSQMPNNNYQQQNMNYNQPNVVYNKSGNNPLGQQGDSFLQQEFNNQK